jgi:hypothetical protein
MTQPSLGRPGQAPAPRDSRRARALAELAQHLDRRVRGDERGRRRGAVRGGRALLVALAPALLLNLLAQQRVRAHRPRRVSHLLRAPAARTPSATCRNRTPWCPILGDRSLLPDPWRPSHAGQPWTSRSSAAWAAALPSASAHASAQRDIAGQKRAGRREGLRWRAVLRPSPDSKHSAPAPCDDAPANPTLRIAPGARLRGAAPATCQG